MIGITIQRIAIVFFESGAVRWSCGLLIVIIFFALTISARTHHNHTREIWLGGVQTYLDNHLKQNESVGAVLCECTYPLLGKTLRRKVVTLSPKARTFASWLQEIRAQHVSIIAIGPIPPGNEQTILWLTKKPEVFTRVLGVDFKHGIVLYRFNDTVKQNAGASK